MKKERLRAFCPEYDLLYQGIDLKKEIGSNGLRLYVPRSFLFGTQCQDEYDSRKRRQIEKTLEEIGMGYLFENPVIAVALKNETGMTLAVIDGHHRSRYSRPFGVAEIPTLITSPDLLSEIINKHRQDKITTDFLVATIRGNIADTLKSFNTLADARQPTIVLEAQRLEDLSKIFKLF